MMNSGCGHVADLSAGVEAVRKERGWGEAESSSSFAGGLPPAYPRVLLRQNLRWELSAWDGHQRLDPERLPDRICSTRLPTSHQKSTMSRCWKTAISLEE